MPARAMLCRSPTDLAILEKEAKKEATDRRRRPRSLYDVMTMYVRVTE